MAVWAYECKSCPAGSVWWVARSRIDELQLASNVLRVKVGKDWRCAVVDRTHAVEVESQLLREAVASDVDDCPDCAPRPADAPDVESAPQAGAAASLQAAAISLAGRRMMVVLARLDLVQNPGEAEMLIADLRPRFGSVDIVLMGQDDDGMPHYHGDAELLSLLAGVPVDRMPWKAYAFG
ncbi:MAG: hypothetical protein Q8L49_12755 [Burkholderiaceae bacterium]|nr:hypothetical protein [Burkholderiaceae bacterium]